MTSWYYAQADQAVGPFQPEVLGKLVRAGVIGQDTMVRRADDEEWQPLAIALAPLAPTTPAPSQPEARYYYLDAADQPIGPLDAATLRRLHDEQVIQADTLVSGIGDTAWAPAGRLFGLPGVSLPSAATPVVNLNGNEAHPRHLPVERFVLLMAVTLTFYPFYLIPCQSRDLKAITGRERMEYTALLVLGIITLGLLLSVMAVLWAFDLERHGKAIDKAGRQGSLGLQVLGLFALGFILALTIDNFLVGCLVTALCNGNGLWMLQKEINLYAAAPDPVAVAT